MGLTDRKEEQLRKMPVIETRIFKSKDGKYVVHKTVITSIKPVAYYEAVLSNEPALDAEDVEVGEAEA